MNIAQLNTIMIKNDANNRLKKGMRCYKENLVLDIKSIVDKEYESLDIYGKVMSESDIGVAPNDIVPFIIKDKLNCQYRWVRIAFDATFLIVGFILGGKVGIGTIIAMLAIGPFIQFCLPYGKKFVGIVLNGKEKSNNESTVIA